MAKFELAIVKDYVPEWTFVDGVREIFQNALDQQTEDENNKMYFNYDEEDQLLSIGNKTSLLTTKSLLLGATTKSENEEVIGQFGEGYKIATLVLTREGHPVTIYNYGAREVWNPRFVNSKRYGAEVLTFFVDKKYPWNKVPNNDLTITIENVTKEKYAEIVESNLHLQSVGETFMTNKGEILLEPRYKGKVFVNGLYVTHYDKYVYGYNFKPKYLELDRDRKLVDNFNLRWLASEMWLDQGNNDDMKDIASKLIENNAADVEYIGNIGNSYYGTTYYTDTANLVYGRFIKAYGNNAVPVSTQSELESIPSSYKPIMVTTEYRNTLKASEFYKEPERVYKPTIDERLGNWLDEHRQSLSKRAIFEMEEIIQDILDE